MGIFRSSFVRPPQRPSFVTTTTQLVSNIETLSLSALAQKQNLLSTSSLSAAGQTSLSVQSALAAVAQILRASDTDFDAISKALRTVVSSLDAASQKHLSILASLAAAGLLSRTATAAFDARGQLAGITPVADVNQNATLWPNTTYLIRVRVINSGVSENGNSFRWAYSHEGGAWTPITTSSNVCRAVVSSSFDDGDDVVEELGPNGTYITDNNAFSEDGATTLPANFGADEACEFMLAFQLRSEDVLPGETVGISLEIDGGARFDSYVNSFTATVGPFVFATLTALAQRQALIATSLTPVGQIISTETVSLEALAQLIRDVEASLEALGSITDAIQTDLNAVSKKEFAETSLLDIISLSQFSIQNTLNAVAQATFQIITSLDSIGVLPGGFQIFAALEALAQTTLQLTISFSSIGVLFKSVVSDFDAVAKKVDAVQFSFDVAARDTFIISTALDALARDTRDIQSTFEARAILLGLVSFDLDGIGKRINLTNSVLFDALSGVTIPDIHGPLHSGGSSGITTMNIGVSGITRSSYKKSVMI